MKRLLFTILATLMSIAFIVINGCGGGGSSNKEIPPLDQSNINHTPSNLAKTNQETCYNSDGKAISCSGTGQDGEYKAGVVWPTPRFVDNGVKIIYNQRVTDNTMTDNMTGLIWSKNANPAGSTKNWQDALDYIKKLNNDNYLGHNDWRLPNINEMKSMINIAENKPLIEQSTPEVWLIDQGFNYFSGNNGYWTSSTYAYKTSSAWAVYLKNGNVVSEEKTNYNINDVWPVRGGNSGTSAILSIFKTGQTTCYDTVGNVISCSGTGQDGELQFGASWPTPRFIDNGNDTLTDNLTGLIWSKDASQTSKTSWQGALDYIKSLNLNHYLGHNDWRLPNSNELASLINIEESDQAAWLNEQGFSSVKAYFYWTSSSFAYYNYLPGSKELNNAANYAWFVGMTDGYVYTDNKSFNAHVWPVRDRL